MTIEHTALGAGSTRVIERSGSQDVDLFELPTDEIQEVYKESGALIFRGFDVSDPTRMHSFAEKFSTRFNRDRLRPTVAGSDGYVQAVLEGQGFVEPHAEQANSPFRPDALWFCCQTPSKDGGETLLWDGVRVWERLDEDLRELFETRRIRFFQKYEEDKWQLFLGGDATLEDLRNTLDALDGVSYFLHDDRSIYLEYVVSAVVTTKYGNHRSFANSLMTERENTLGDAMALEDGTTISDADIGRINEVMMGVTEEIPWQPGDLAFIDNSRFLHGRNPYNDPGRRIFSSLSFLNF
ncbi:taurine catabolism dioxygenase TauD [Streptomonospora alba]|uniref:Taurine catabolism dioxygenase TauD n=1 Tax=Streptomonospora alba TaxID=183763 RepID=A0A0C2JS01_9ACTN|nr:TauD/TfdA family dioxygenase [Streptomonospora alba]KIH99602.1 taurine catabolism dioxygenase TauD [Streptomonospora alba]